MRPINLTPTYGFAVQYFRALSEAPNPPIGGDYSPEQRAVAGLSAWVAALSSSAQARRAERAHKMIAALTAWPRAAERALSRRRRNAGLRAAIALGAYAGMLAEDHLSPTEATFASIAHAAETLDSTVSYTVDSGSSPGAIYRFSFGYGYGYARKVTVLGSDLEGALEAAAGELPSGAFVDVEELLKEAREEAREDECDEYAEVDEDAILEDLTYTESGYLESWAWGVDDSSIDAEIDELADAAVYSDLVADYR